MKKTLWFLVLAFLLVFVTPAHAGTSTVSLAWDPPDIATDVTGYKVHMGIDPGQYTVHYDAGLNLTYALSLPDGTYYFAVTAYNAAGIPSVYSNEVKIVLDTKPPGAPKNLRTVSVKVTVNVKTGSIVAIATTGQ